jgi:hypothetical protein
MEISKRDYFAAQALTGLLARPAGPGRSTPIYGEAAMEAFQYADAMMRLSKTLLEPVEIDPNEFAKRGASDRQVV